MPTAPQPTASQLRVLRKLAAGEDLRDFAATDDEVKATWDCLIAGWVDCGRITPAGRRILAQHDRTDDVAAPAKTVTLAYRQINPFRVFLAPVEGAAEIVEEYEER